VSAFSAGSAVCHNRCPDRATRLLPDLSSYWNIQGIGWLLASVAIARRLAAGPAWFIWALLAFDCIAAALLVTPNHQNVTSPENNITGGIA